MASRLICGKHRIAKGLASRADAADGRPGGFREVVD
jgi:hypothetical protein